MSNFKRQEKLLKKKLTPTQIAINEQVKLGNIQGTRSGKGKDEEQNLLRLGFGPVAYAFIHEHSFTSTLLGPIGSGKTVAMFCKILFISLTQQKGRDGVRRTRHVIVRDTKPKLKNTTIKTFKQWFSRFDMIYKESTDEAIVKINDAVIEFKFLGIETPEDLEKLLSLEATTIYFNELSGIHPKIWQFAQQRVGRYPSVGGNGVGCWFDLEKCLEYDMQINPELMEYDKIYVNEEVMEKGVITTKVVEKLVPMYQNFCVFADTNPPREDSWHKKLFEKELFNEKTGADENPTNFKLYRQPSGFSRYAENINNLPKGYYENIKKGQPKEVVDQMVRVKYGIGEFGMPVFGKYFNTSKHVIEGVKEKFFNKKKRLIVGMDFGLNPSCVIGQYYDDTFYIFDELYTRDRDKMSLDEFFKHKFNDFIMEHYPDYAKNKQNIMFCIDPAGNNRDTSHGWTCVRVIADHDYRLVKIDSTNRLPERIKAVREILQYRKDGELVMDTNGRQRFYIDKKCHWTISGLKGNYFYENVKKGETVSEKPCKNEYSHIQDGLQYACVRVMKRNDEELSLDFNNFGLYNDFDNDGIYDTKIGY